MHLDLVLIMLTLLKLYIRRTSSRKWASRKEGFSSEYISYYKKFGKFIYNSIKNFEKIHYYVATKGYFKIFFYMIVSLVLPLL